MIEKIALTHKTSMTKYAYELLGREAARDYLSRNIPLNQSIEKFASDKDLNQAQIERVCEAANKEVYLHLFKKGSAGVKEGSGESYEKYITFDLADASKITASMGKEASIVTSDPSDYFKSVPKELMKDISTLDFKSPEKEKTAKRNDKMAFDLLDKMNSVRQMVEGRLEVSVTKLAGAQSKFYNAVRTSLLNKEATLKALHGLSSKLHKTKTAYVNQAFKDVLTEMRSRDMDLMLKVAAAVDENLISDDLDELVPDTGVQIINGRHPVFYELDTLIPQYEDVNKFRERLVVVDEHVKYIKHRIFGEVV